MAWTDRCGYAVISAEDENYLQKHFGKQAPYKEIKKKYNDLVLSIEDSVRIMKRYLIYIRDMSKD